MNGVHAKTPKAENKTLFVLTQKNAPPFSASDRLAAKGKYEQEIAFLFTNNSNIKRFIPVIYTKKLYKKLYIQAINVFHEDIPYLVMLDGPFELPNEIRSPKEEPSSAAWVTDGEYYWLNGFFATQINNSRNGTWPQKTDFGKIFSNRLGTTESFECKIGVRYKFDDEPMKHLVLYYDVEPRKTAIGQGEKRLFIITQDNMPPFGAEERLATKGEYEQELVFLFTNRSNKKDFIPVIYTKKKYKKLYVNTLYLVYSDWPYLLMADAEFTLPEKLYYHVGHNEIGWRSDGEYYWLNGFFAEAKDEWHWSKRWPKDCDFELIFEDKLYAVEPFTFRLEFWYHFDDEPEKHIVLNYTVEPREVDEAQRKRGGW